MEQFRHLVHRRVQLWSRLGTHEFQDEGTLRAFTDRWVTLENDDGEWLLFPLIAVRLVKLLRETRHTNRF